MKKRTHARRPFNETVLRGADAILYCQDVRASYEVLRDVRQEVEAAGINRSALLVATKVDEATEHDLALLQAAVPDLPVRDVSVLDDESLEHLKEAIWQLTGLIRVYLRRGKKIEEEPLALKAHATVVDVATQIHQELGASFRHARVWGPSARFDGQQVGRNHIVQDGDSVEIIV